MFANLEITVVKKRKGKKSAASRTKYLQDKLQKNEEIRYGETFRILSFLEFEFAGQSDRKWSGWRENVRFSMKRMEQYSRIAFWVKITRLFILSHLTTPWKMLLYPFLKHSCFILFQFDYWWKCWYCSFNWRIRFIMKQSHGNGAIMSKVVGKLLTKEFSET